MVPAAGLLDYLTLKIRSGQATMAAADSLRSRLLYLDVRAACSSLEIRCPKANSHVIKAAWSSYASL